MTITSIGFGVVAVVIGVIVASANYGVTRYEIPYPPTCRVGQPCTIQFRPDRDLSGPVYFHYKIEGMYQNHRRYVKSRSGAQLRGEPGAATGSCQPLERNGARVLYPCGLIAASKFGDRIALRIDGASQTGRTPFDWRLNR